MQWFILALISAVCLGLYDVLRKYSVRNNPVLPVLAVSTLSSVLLLLPFKILSATGGLEPTADLYIPGIEAHAHMLLVIKAAIVLSSWIFVYFGIKNLPLSIVAPIRATAPILTLMGALIIFAERPNSIQWVGLCVTFLFFFLFSLAGAREGVNFRANKWVWSVILGTLIGAGSALFDKHIIAEAHIPRMSVLFYYSIYQFLMTLPLMRILWYPGREREPFSFHWSMPLIGIVIIAADFFYYGALDNQDALISLVSPIRRSNSIISFTLAAILFHEHNILRKGLCLFGILGGIAVIIYGSM